MKLPDKHRHLHNTAIEQQLYTVQNWRCVVMWLQCRVCSVSTTLAWRRSMATPLTLPPTRRPAAPTTAVLDPYTYLTVALTTASPWRHTTSPAPCSSSSCSSAASVAFCSHRRRSTSSRDTSGVSVTYRHLNANTWRRSSDSLPHRYRLPAACAML